MNIALLQGLIGGGVRVPFQFDALLNIDGTILQVESNYYLADKSINHRHLLITDYDFPENWTGGFPYKSAATVSAPVGDAALIAADVNNFFYDSGGNPNQIPVVSFFQNVDYANKLFCRHQYQLLGVNAVETVEPRVKEIVLYSNTKSGDDLTKCNIYYNVPTENITATWASLTGNDTTGTGTKANPYRTIAKATLSKTVNDTVYVKTGLYVEGTTTFLPGNAGNIISTGYTTIRPTNSTSETLTLASSVTQTLEGFILDSTTTTGVYTNAGIKTLKRFYIKNVTTYSINSGGTGVNLINSIIIGAGIIANSITSTFETNIIKTVGAKRSILASTAATNFAASHNKFIPGTSTSAAETLGTWAANSTVTIHDNYFDLTGVTAQRTFTSTTSQNINFTYNRIYSTSITTVSNFKISTGYVGNVLIENNKFNFTSTGDFTGANPGIIEIFDAVSPIVRNNFIYLNTAYNLTAIRIASYTGNDMGSPIVENNYISTMSNSGYIINIGTENSSTTTNNKMVPIIISNRITGPADRNSYNVNALMHSIFVGNNLNPIIKYNHVSGCGIGIVLKHEDNGVYTTDKIFGNVLINNYRGFTIKGVDGAKLYNNIIKSNIATAYGIVLSPHSLGTVNEVRNLVIKNNIIDVAYTAYTIPTGLDVGHVFNYNQYSVIIRFAEYHGSAIDWTAWKVLGYDANSQSNTIVLTDNLYPTTPIAIGENLGTDYDDDLDTTTNWGSATQVPTVVTKQQSVPWQVGAYVQ